MVMQPKPGLQASREPCTRLNRDSLAHIRTLRLSLLISLHQEFIHTQGSLAWHCQAPAGSTRKARRAVLRAAVGNPLTQAPSLRLMVRPFHKTLTPPPSMLSDSGLPAHWSSAAIQPQAAQSPNNSSLTGAGRLKPYHGSAETRGETWQKPALVTGTPTSGMGAHTTKHEPLAIRPCAKMSLSSLPNKLTAPLLTASQRHTLARPNVMQNLHITHRRASARSLTPYPGRTPSLHP